ncbi:bifunctional hydroxymethylpyrimidine kinase/phosphomethylpyrimidine kinase [Corynebacterium lubricantis]|uniref:bifunctional hydroxymethylpyrimidine kinase/phosphomethylpyrimidine kinase n=1 Tax=Corynebacterium lubricantis TaxID=541095 RepID=UPI00036EDF6F|nr:bifunctional hydroxymethylpyrimidine kinase/phosphomethylpyrimidine kinase [Corynebacterium lubricantis]
MIPRILSIAGTDPTGGAGAQADIKSISAAGGFAYSVITSVVSQNTRGVTAVHTPPPETLLSQLAAVRDDVAIDAVKIGMLGSIEVTEIVAAFVAKLDCPVILDPVMIASSGDRLLASDAEQAVLALAHHADVVTPNLPELAVLAEEPVADTIEAAIAQATRLAGKINALVLMKGGHLCGGQADNALVSPDGSVHRIPVNRVDTSNTHGTGCSLSSALATKLAAGLSPNDAAEWATRWIHESIRYADELHIGDGNGPVDHTHALRRMTAAASTRPWEHSTSAPTEARLAPAGPYTERLWQESAPYLTDIMALPFIHDLGSGALRHADFTFYVQQDALYLNRYATALRKLGGDWAIDADNAIEVEQDMHRTWLAHSPAATLSPSPVTRAYTDFLVAETHAKPQAIGEAAVLPCYWLYFEVGTRLADRNSAEHPYRKWLDTYSGPDFENSARSAVRRIERTLEQSPELLDEAAEACRLASRHEVEFFAQADRAWVSN